MSRSVLRRSASAAVLTLALTSLAACGGDDGNEADDSGSGGGTSAFDQLGSGSSDEPSESSQPTDSPSEESTEQAEPTEGEDIEPSEMVGVFSSAFEQASTATFTMSLGGAASFDAEGAADFSKKPTAMTMTINVGQMQPIKMVLVDNMLYQQNPGTSKYTATSLDDPSSPFASLGDQLDIRSQFDTMEKAMTGATYVGEEDGMDHYSVVLDSATLLESQGGGVTPPAGSLPPSFTYELYFDEDGYFRKMVSDLGDVGGQVTAAYDNWGDPVDIKAPPASQVQ